MQKSPSQKSEQKVTPPQQRRKSNDGEDPKTRSPHDNTKSKNKQVQIYDSLTKDRKVKKEEVEGRNDN